MLNKHVKTVHYKLNQIKRSSYQINQTIVKLYVQEEVDHDHNELGTWEILGQAWDNMAGNHWVKVEGGFRTEKEANQAKVQWEKSLLIGGKN